MKTRIIILIFAAGFLTSGGFADNLPAASAPAGSKPQQLTPGQITNAAPAPGVAESGGTSAEPKLTVRQIVQSELALSYRRGEAGQTKTAVHRVLSPADLVTNRTVGARAVFSMTPTPFSYNAPNQPTTWYASVSFPLGHGHRS